MFKNRDFVEIEMGGDKYKLVATPNEILGLEEILNVGLIELMERLLVKGLKSSQIVDIIVMGLAANGDTRLSRKDILGLMFKDGSVSYHKAVSSYCQILLDGVGSEGEVQGKSESD